MNLDSELRPIRCVDVILAVLQGAFSQTKLTDSGNVFFYNASSPATSKLWVCHDDARMEERDGNRGVITVSRGEITPGEMHLQNFGGDRVFSDILTVPIFIKCEHGTSVMSETLAAMAYSVIKFFRQEIMSEFDLHDIKLLGISAASKQPDIPGSPFITSVSLRLMLQERIVKTELTNDLTGVTIVTNYNHNISTTTKLILDS